MTLLRVLRAIWGEGCVINLALKVKFLAILLGTLFFDLVLVAMPLALFTAESLCVRDCVFFMLAPAVPLLRFGFGVFLT